MNSKLTYLIFSFLGILCSITDVSAAQLCGQPKQGEILFGRAERLQTVKFNNQDYRVTPDGWFLIAFGRDDKPEQKVTLIDKNNLVSNYNLTLAPTKWDVQSLKGVPPRKVTPSDADLRDIEKETKLVRAGQKNDTTEALWRKGFIRPVEGRISGNFGGQRIMNGVKKNPHAGMDIAALEGTEVKASSDGVVTLAAPDLFYSGNVIILDHGYGLFTVYAHLSKIMVKPGQIVKQGDVIGLVGKTGRVTGPHLHWGASLKGTRFNPQSLLNLTVSDDFCFNL